MESVQLELPSDLLQQVRQEIPSEAALSQVVRAPGTCRDLARQFSRIRLEAHAGR